MRLMEEIFQFSRSKVEFYPSILIDVSSFSHIFSIDFDGFCRFFGFFQLFFALNRHLILFSRSFFVVFLSLFIAFRSFSFHFFVPSGFFHPLSRKKQVNIRQNKGYRFGSAQIDPIIALIQIKSLHEFPWHLN